MKSFASRLFAPGLIATNLGLLGSLLFGPNSDRANGAFFGVGLGVLSVGLLCLAIGAYSRRRDSSPPVSGA